MNAYFMSQICYCPLVWINQSRTLNNHINRLHKRALGLVYNDFSSRFSELLEKFKSVTIHHRNLETLAYEILKVKNNTALEIFSEIFPQKTIEKEIKILEIPRHCRAEVLKLPRMAQKLYLVWDQKYGQFIKAIKTFCVSYIIQKVNLSMQFM